MIGPTHPSWRPVRLENEQSIEYLNKLFRQGWYMVAPDEDLPFMLLSVPVKTPKRTVFKSPSAIVDAQNQPMMQVIIVHKGNRRNRQMAMIKKRNEAGYFDLVNLRKELPGWNQIIALTLEDDETWVTIVERKGDEGNV
jgi:hypothetical protein